MEDCPPKIENNSGELLAIRTSELCVYYSLLLPSHPTQSIVWLRLYNT